MGDGQRICLQDGMWSGREAVCEGNKAQGSCLAQRVAERHFNAQMQPPYIFSLMVEQYRMKCDVVYPGFCNGTGGDSNDHNK